MNDYELYCLDFTNFRVGKSIQLPAKITIYLMILASYSAKPIF